jgi:hypothetical protein
MDERNEEFSNALTQVAGQPPTIVAFHVSHLREIADGLENGQLILESLHEQADIKESIDEDAKEVHYAFTGRKSLAFVYQVKWMGPENSACPGCIPVGKS